MKKIFLFASVVIALTSCKKETESSVQPETKKNYDKNNLEEIIKYADSGLYEKVKTVFHPNTTRTTTGPIIRFAHGIYTEKKWYCIPANCICFIEVIDTKLEEIPNEEGMKLITEPISETYSNPENVYMILVKGENTEVHNISSMNTTVSKGQVAVDFTEIN